MEPSSVRPATQVVVGDRISREGKLRLGCDAVLFNPSRDAVLLTRRTDNGLWCLPGGIIDPGESITETCVRELREETCLEVRVVRLIGVYSNVDRLIIYPDGNKADVVVLCFEVEQVGGQPCLSSETTAIRFFPLAEALRMDLFHGHAEHLRDAISAKSAAFIR